MPDAALSAALGAASPRRPAPPPPAPPPVASASAAARNPFGVEARLDLSSRLKLEQIRVQLLRQEDNIIFGWVKRSAYRRNPPVYAAGGMAAHLPPGDAAAGASLLEWHLQQTEARFVERVCEA
jgi:hypothetical protein